MILNFGPLISVMTGPQYSEMTGPVKSVLDTCGEIYNLTPENIVKVGSSGELWLTKDRGKTEVSEAVPILSIVAELIEKYKDHPKCKLKNWLMPVNSNYRYN